MAREAARGDRPDPVDGHEGDIEYQRSPEGELEAREYWAWNHRYCTNPFMAGPRPCGERPTPTWYYMWLD